MGSAARTRRGRTKTGPGGGSPGPRLCALEATPEDVFLNLARQGSREFGYQLDAFRRLLFGDAQRLEVREHLLERQLLVIARDDERAHLLAVLRVGDRRHRGLLNLGMRGQRLFDLARRDVLATADDDVLLAVRDHQVAVL